MKHAAPIHYWQSPHLPGLELSHSHHREFSYGRHVHLDYHIGLVQRGGQKFIHKGSSHALVRGELSTVNPDEMHDGLSLLPEGYEVRVFSIDPHQLATWLPGGEHFFDRGLQRRPDLYTGFARLHMYLEDPKVDGLLAESELLALLGELLQLAPSEHKLADPQLRFLRGHLLDRLDERHSLEDLAALFGLDRFAFLRQFKKKTGMTPYAWLKRLRLERSKALLARGMAVSEVALTVGFFDQSHFHHGFRQAFGLTPADYRQQMQSFTSHPPP
ncbi:AraC family transcriptional regulator [Aeromonas rivuli]|uniref:AraC family transcriptional regulator n=1 Tax=Aeromonas rivuli TaxID=648794 RepID=UPI001CCF083C|nr:AraC family transcriptional regulator [Aeromonas rivuli]UBO74167.1 AraC family transcriptional regulator [Aeromonas rivuli]